MWSPSDGLFGPQLADQFDFTLLFENTMLTLVPGGVVVLAIPFYLRLALEASRHVRAGILLYIKLAVGLTMVAIHATSLHMWHEASLFRSELGLSAAIMSLVSSVCILLILYIAHIYSLQPSGFLSAFLSVTAIFDIVMTRSYFRREGLNTIAALQVVVAVLKFALIILEEVSKRSLFRTAQLRNAAARETVSGFWNRAVFGWLNALMMVGYRTELRQEDLANIDDEFDSMRLFDRFTPQWSKVDKTSKSALVKALAFTLPWQVTQSILPRLLFVGLMFAQPFLLFRVVDTVHSEAPEEIRNGLVGATALVFTGVAITRALYEHMSYRALTSVRGILIVAIYDKMHRLSTKKLARSAAITLMSTDVSAVEQMVSLLYELWASTFQVALGIWSLWLYVRAAGFLMLIPGLLSSIASHYLGKAMMKARTAWNKQIEGRVAATSNILAQVKAIKSMGLSEVMLSYLQHKRTREIETSMEDRRLRVWLFALGSMNFALSPVIVLAGAIFWTRESNPLTVAEVFAVIAMIFISTDPFMRLLNCMVQWSAGMASLRRIQKFLCLQEMDDSRENFDDSDAESESDTAEKKAEGSNPAYRAPLAVQFDLVAVTSTVMGPILSDVSLQIPWGTLAMVWGSINSGKSTLLRCIIGEVKPDAGVIKVGTKSIAYCDQQTWLRNGTLKANVISVLEFVEVWYQEVLTACGLDIDIMAFANGDLVMIGTGGCNLSGGQKQRLSLARAVYARASIMVVDDVLSGLDPDTAQFVFSNVFGPDGLVRRWNCTVIMTTNQLHFMDYAGMIFQVHQGGFVEQQSVDLSDEDSPAATPPKCLSEAGDQNDHDDGYSEDDAGDNGQAGATVNPTTELPSVKPSKENLELKNAREKRQDGDWSLYSYFLGPGGWLTVGFWVSVVAVAALIEQMPTIFIRIWYGKNAKNRNYFIGYVAFALASIVFNSGNGLVFFFYLLPKSSEELHSRVAETVLFATMDYLTQTDAGNMLSRFSQDMFITSQSLPITLTQFVYIFFTVLVEIGVIAAGSAYAAPIMIFLFVVLFVVQLFYLRTSRQLRLLELESSATLYTQFSETSSGIQHIRSFGWQSQYLVELCHCLNESQKPYYYLLCCQRWLHIVLDFTAAISAVVLVLLAVKLPHTTSNSAVGLALLNLIGFNGTTSFLLRSWTNMETGLGAISRIKSFCKSTPRERDTLSGPDISHTWPDDGRLDFNCVSATYHANDGTSFKALDNVNLTIYPGDKVGISGRTGSGKSSIFMSILRMVDFKGTISIDGRNIKSVSREFLRSRITTLTQDGVELKGSLRFNIYPFAGPQPDDNSITSTLRSLGLLQHVNQHGGLDASISSMGFSVSQKQLLFICRGVLHRRIQNTTLVIMDEATSAMDSGTDNNLQAFLDQSFAGCTVLQVAHRVDSFRGVNVRVSLDAGQVRTVQRRGSNGQWR